MKYIMLFAIILSGRLCAQSPEDSFVNSVNAAWSSKDYNAIESNITSAMQARPHDLIVLYAAYNFYVMVKPDLPKLTDAANRIKVIADACDKAPVKAVSAGIQKNMAEITAQGVAQPDQDTLTELHVTFDDEFPLISMGKRLQAILQQ